MTWRQTADASCEIVIFHVVLRNGFASSLVANDLVDEYQFYVNPVTLREGLSIFKERGIDSKLKLREGEAYASGIVVTRYSQGSLDQTSARPAR